jgi:hypothetical protein
VAQAFDLAGIINTVCAPPFRALCEGAGATDACRLGSDATRFRNHTGKIRDPDLPALKQARPSTLSYGSQVLQQGHSTQNLAPRWEWGTKTRFLPLAPSIPIRVPVEIHRLLYARTFRLLRPPYTLSNRALVEFELLEALLESSVLRTS